MSGENVENVLLKSRSIADDLEYSTIDTSCGSRHKTNISLLLSQSRTIYQGISWLLTRQVWGRVWSTPIRPHQNISDEISYFNDREMNWSFIQLPRNLILRPPKWKTGLILYILFLFLYRTATSRILHSTS